MSASLLFSSTHRKRRRPSPTLADVFLGPRRSWESNLTVTDVTVRLPEGEYPALVRIFISTVKRPRWPWLRKTVQAEIQLFRAIPVPAPDGDNLIYTFTCQALTPEDALRHLVRVVKAERQKYGGADWRPV